MLETFLQRLSKKAKSQTKSEKHITKKTKEDVIQLLLEFGQAYPKLPEADQKKIANVLIASNEIFPTKRAFGYLNTIHFSFPVLSGDETKQTMTIGMLIQTYWMRMAISMDII